MINLTRNLIAAAGIAALAGIGLMTASESRAAEFELVAGLQVNPDSPFDLGLKRLAELVEERSDGRLKINIFTGGQLGNEPELFQGMMAGSVDIAVVAPGQIAEWVPEIALLEMPFMITSAEQRDKVVEGTPMEHMARLIEERTNVEIAGVFGGGVRNMFFREPVTSAEDLVGRRFRVQPSRQLTDSYGALGLEPVVTSYQELYNALQQGVAEGAEMEAVFVEQAALMEAAPHFVRTGHVITIRLLGISKQTFERLPDDLDVILRESAVEAARYERGIEGTKDAESIARMAKVDGVTFTDIDIEPMIEKVRPVWEKYASEWGLTDMLNEIDSMR